MVFSSSCYGSLMANNDPRTPVSTFDPTFGPTPFHLGCNAMAYNVNCGICAPDGE